MLTRAAQQVDTFALTDENKDTVYDDILTRVEPHDMHDRPPGATKRLEQRHDLGHHRRRARN